MADPRLSASIRVIRVQFLVPLKYAPALSMRLPEHPSWIRMGLAQMCDFLCGVVVATGGPAGLGAAAGDRIINHRSEIIMQLNAPKQITWVIALVLGLLGLLFYFFAGTNVYAFWVMLVAYVVIMASTVLKGL